MGNLGVGIPILTDITVDLCQHSMREPEFYTYQQQATIITAQAKRRNNCHKSGEDSSLMESENTEEEDARTKAATFLMSAA